MLPSEGPRCRREGPRRGEFLEAPFLRKGGGGRSSPAAVWVLIFFFAVKVRLEKNHIKIQRFHPFFGRNLTKNLLYFSDFFPAGVKK